ncbi:thiolase C-terminal domain-containing protein [Amycolatopsis sp.]|uniref:thiolase C-terminal domain-containing protein n=1 Tax=Amycolatopsis sp. TaxID=37632 RepID=UPI002BE3384E|nr:OB-fold domain-containing protein [Amycolatopsis sp.]HVV11883.1 OB-fold domain-containing protein [Amycolatopsis sp.]
MQTAATLPRTDGPSGYFWTSGADRTLRVGRCAGCSRLLHPAVEICPDCGAEGPAPEPVSGRGTVVACTLDRHQFSPEHPPPYVVAIVALAEDPRLRLTTNVVGCSPEEVVVGLPVHVTFSQVDDVWLPLFAPSGGAGEPIEVPAPSVAVRAAPSRDRFEHEVAVAGVGRSRFGRRLNRTPLALSVEACRAALDDAGLAAQDVDGVCSYPGTDGLPGVSDGGVRGLEHALRLKPTWHLGAAEVPGQAGIVVAAMLAVASGLCRTVLCVTSVSTEKVPGLRKNGARIEGEGQWRLPFGATSPAHWIALYASQYLSRYRVGREALGWIAISSRAHAARNPDALHRDPIDMGDYLAARSITTPFGLLDCDVPCDGAVALVVSALDQARDLRHPPVRVEAVGTQLTEPQSWDQGTLTHQPNLFGPAAHLWSRTDLRPTDVDVALLYDGFTFNALCWLEALGFCGIGEAGDFVAGAERIGPGGALPLNPHGGQLAAGRSNGFDNLGEAVLQLRGDAGARQVPGVEVAVATSGGGIPAGALLLTTDR